ncbi:MAG: hypothetical protein AB3N19_16480 [Ruegeria sp.]
MPVFKVEGKELKKLVKHARENPVSFAFNPGAKDDHYFGLHRKQPAKAIAKEAKDIGSGKRVAFGEMSVSETVMRLQCDKQVPAMAKTLKRWLKKQKVKLDVVIVDADGTVLDSDVDAQESQDASDAEKGINPNEKAATLERLKAISDRIKDLPKEAAAPLVVPFKSIVKLANAGDIERAQLGADKLDQALAKLEKAPAQGSEAPQKPGTSKSNPDAAKWNAQAAKIKPAVEEVLARSGQSNSDSPEYLELRQLWATANEQANGDQPNYSAALQTIPRIVELVKKLRNAQSFEDVSPEVQPFAKARATWQSARTVMNSEMQKLQSEIAKVCQGDTQFEKVLKNVPSLTKRTASLDDRLDKALVAVVKSEAGKPREKSKSEVIRILKDYRSMLDTDFFKHVDSNNGFTKVSVTKTARKALGEIARVVA